MKRNIRNQTAILLCSAVFAGTIIAIDVSNGPFIRMPALFVFSVLAASWYSGLAAGVVFSIALPAVRLFFEWNIVKPWNHADSVINMALLAVALASVPVVIHYIRQQQRRIKILQGFLPICSFCKKIRTGENAWVQMERYITNHSQAAFTHTLCPECAAKEYTVMEKKGYARKTR